MDEHQTRPDQSAASPDPHPRAWVAPAAFLAVVLIPAVILIFSNTESTQISFLWFHGTAPRWLILAITFAAGALVTRLLGWTWRRMRRHQKAEGGPK